MRPLFASLIAVRRLRCESERDIASLAGAASPEPGREDFRINRKANKQANKQMLSSRAPRYEILLLLFVPDFE